MRVPPLVLFLFFSCGIPPLQSDWSLFCDHGLDYASECENNNNNNNNNNTAAAKSNISSKTPLRKEVLQCVYVLANNTGFADQTDQIPFHDLCVSGQTDRSLVHMNYMAHGSRQRIQDFHRSYRSYPC